IWPSHLQHKLEPGRFVLQYCLRQTVIVSRLSVADLRLGCLQLRLTQLYDRAKTQFVACLGEFERQLCLLEQLLCDRQALVSIIRTQPTGANIPRNSISQIGEAVARGL